MTTLTETAGSLPHRAAETHDARLSTRSIAYRLFITCWLIYSLHVATNTVREIYLTIAIGEKFSFRLDEYANMHPDIFEKKGYGWHHGANPGASMLAAIPYAIFRPAVDQVVNRVNRARAASGQTGPPAYNSPWPMARAFYAESWRRGYDIKFGLAAIISQVFCMAPVSALAVVAMFLLLRHIFGSDRTALWLSVLYAFGTPVFFRTGYLNHNLMLGHIAFVGLLAMWNPGLQLRWSEGARAFIGGIAGGAALLFDYSGVVFLVGLFGYALIRGFSSGGVGNSVRNGAYYVCGSIGPIVLLWVYQWQSFGHPFYPGQHWMPPVEWIDIGYQGFSLPQAELLFGLLADYRYGLFLTCPLLLLSLAAPFVSRSTLPRRELWTLLGLAAGLVLFCSCISYTRLQFNTGLRYLAPLLPFLFVPAAITLVRLPLRATYFIGVASVAQGWCMAMYRDVERGTGLLEPVLNVLFGGLQLPILSVLSRMGGQYGSWFERGVSPLPLFLLAAAILYGVWLPLGKAPESRD